jgi:hypothetical protein
VIAGLASKGCKTVVDACPLDEYLLLDQIAPEGCVSSFYVVGVAWSFASTGRLHIF